MKKIYESDRIRTLKEIAGRNTSRDIEGCTSWRHFVVHLDRAWLLSAIDNIRDQVEKIHRAENDPGSGYDFDTEVHALLGMFEEDTLNHIGDT